ncbi:MAG: hypothetical protein HY366_02230 [Candidatus Aenigmarchaeota archaeon]|nr:hypothetical protein [Candidatus Aenigmarchaeota archaeon]
MKIEDIKTINSVSVTVLAAFALVIAGLTIGETLPLVSGTTLILNVLAVIVLVTIYVRLEELMANRGKR